MNGYASTFPTVTFSTCSSGTNCAIGGSCTATSQCVTGSCCGLINNPNTTAYAAAYQQYPYNISALANGTFIATTQAAYTALFNGFYQSNQQYCLSSTNGSSTVTYYNTTSDLGAYAPSTDTSTYNTYSCNNRVIYNPNYSPYQAVFPTVTSANCPSGSNCATGSTCTSQSQCAAGNCCAYVIPYNNGYGPSDTSMYANQFKKVNDTYMVTSNNQTLQTVMKTYYSPTRYCLSNVNGNSTTTYYNSTSFSGVYLNSTNTSALNPYVCQSMFGYQMQAASVLETMQALILVAFSFAYLQLA